MEDHLTIKEPRLQQVDPQTTDTKIKRIVKVSEDKVHLHATYNCNAPPALSPWPMPWVSPKHTHVPHTTLTRQVCPIPRCLSGCPTLPLCPFTPPPCFKGAPRPPAVPGCPDINPHCLMPP